MLKNKINQKVVNKNSKQIWGIVIILLMAIQIAGSVYGQKSEDLQAPIIYNVYTYPKRITCLDRITVYAEVYDPSGIADIRLTYVNTTGMYNVSMVFSHSNGTRLVFKGYIEKQEENTNPYYFITVKDDSPNHNVGQSPPYYLTIYNPEAPSFKVLEIYPERPWEGTTPNITVSCYDPDGIEGDVRVEIWQNGSFISSIAGNAVGDNKWQFTLPSASRGVKVEYQFVANDASPQHVEGRSAKYSYTVIPKDELQESSFSVWYAPMSPTIGEGISIYSYIWYPLSEEFSLDNVTAEYRIDDGEEKIIPMVMGEEYYLFQSVETIPAIDHQATVSIQIHAIYSYLGVQSEMYSQQLTFVVKDNDAPQFKNISIMQNNIPITDEIADNEPINVSTVVYDSSGINYVICYYLDGGEWRGILLHKTGITSSGELWEATIDFQNRVEPTEFYFIVGDKTLWVNTNSTDVFGPFDFYDNTPPAVELTKIKEVSYNTPLTLRAQVEDKSSLNYVNFYLNISNQIIELRGEESAYPNMYITGYMFNMSLVDQEIEYWCEVEDSKGLKTVTERDKFRVVDKTVPYFISFSTPDRINVGTTSIEERRVIVNAADVYDTAINNSLTVTLTYWADTIKTKTILLYHNENEPCEYYGYLPELSKATTLHYYFSIIDSHGNKYTSRNFEVEYHDLLPPVFKDFRVVRDEYSFEEIKADYSAEYVTILVAAEDKEYTKDAQIVGHTMYYEWGLDQLSVKGIRYCSFSPIRTVVENNRTYFWFQIPTDPEIIEQRFALLSRALGDDIENYNLTIHWDYGDVFQFNITLYDWQDNIAETTQIVEVSDATPPEVKNIDVNQEGTNITVDVQIYDISELGRVTIHWTNTTGFQETDANLVGSCADYTTWHVAIPYDWFEETVWIYVTAEDIHGNIVDTAKPVGYYQTRYGTEVNLNPIVVGETVGYKEVIEGKAKLSAIFDEESQFVSFTTPSTSSILYSDEYYINATIEDYERLGYTYSEAQSRYYSFISVHDPLITEEGLSLSFRDDLLYYDTVVIRLPWNFTTSDFLELYLPKYDDALNLTLQIAEKDLKYDKDKKRFVIDETKYPETILYSSALNNIHQGENIVPLNLENIDIYHTDLMLELVIQVNQSTIIPNTWEITLGHIRSFCLGWTYEGKTQIGEDYKYSQSGSNVRISYDTQLDRLLWFGEGNLTIDVGENIGINNIAPALFPVTKLLFVETNGTIAIQFWDGTIRYITNKQSIYPLGSLLAEHGRIIRVTLLTFDNGSSYYVSPFTIYSIQPISLTSVEYQYYPYYLVGIQNAHWKDQLWADGKLHYDAANVTHFNTELYVVTPIRFPPFYNVTYYQQHLIDLNSEDVFKLSTHVVPPVFGAEFEYSDPISFTSDTQTINYVDNPFFIEEFENLSFSHYAAIVTNSSLTVENYKLQYYALSVAPATLIPQEGVQPIFETDGIYFKVDKLLSTVKISLPVNIPCALLSHVVVDISSDTSNFNITKLTAQYENDTIVDVGNFGNEIVTSERYLAEYKDNRENLTVTALNIEVINTQNEQDTLLKINNIEVYYYPVTMPNIKMHDVWAPEILDHYVRGNAYQESDLEVRVKVQDLISGLNTTNPAVIEYYYVYYDTISDPVIASMNFDDQTSEWYYILPDSRNAYRVGYSIANITDKAGNEADPITNMVNIPDVFPPTGTLSVSTHSANYETEIVTLTLDAEGTLHNPVVSAIVNYTFDHITYYTANMTQGEGTVWYYDLGPYALGTTIYVKCQFTDWWGNNGETELTAINWVDLTAPVAVSYYQTNSGDIGYTSETEVWINLEDISGIDTVILYYRIDGGNWQNAGIMSEIGGKYYGVIPSFAASDAGKYVDYYIFANDTEGNGANVIVPGDTSCAFWVVDNVAPEITGMSPQSDINEGEKASWFIAASDEVDSTDLLSATIYYNINGQGYISDTMSYNQLSEQFEYTTVEVFSAGDVVEYYFVVHDQVGNTFTSSVYQRQCVDIYYPSITDIQQTPTQVEYSSSVSISCIMQDSASGSGLNTSTAYLYYQVNSVWYSTLLSQNGNTFSSSIPQYAYGTTVQWYLTVTDNAGHQTVTPYYSYTVQDTTLPVIYTGTLSTSTTSAGEHAHISITIDDVSDTASGIDTVTMELERSPSNPLLRHWEELTLIQVSGNVYTFEVGWIGLQYGEQVNIRVNATDVAGNKEWELIENAFVVTDDTPPTIEDTLHLSTTPVHGGSVTISLGIDDTYSGIYTVVMEYWINGGAHHTLSYSVSGTTYSSTLSGLQYGDTYSFYIYVEDQAGNIAERTFSNRFTVDDDTAPTIESTLNISPSSPKEGQSVTIDLDITDVASGVKTVIIKTRINDGSWTTVSYSHSGITYYVTLSGLQYGDTYDFYVYAEDNEGNSYYRYFYDQFTVIDGTPPSISPSSQSYTVQVYSDLHIDVTVTDTHSAIQSVTISYNRNGAGWAYLTVSHSGSTYSAVIPGAAVIWGATFDIKITATDTYDNDITVIWYDCVNVVDTISPSIADVYSNPNKFIKDTDTVTVYATITDEGLGIDTSTLFLYYRINDGVWISVSYSSLTKSGNTYSYVLSAQPYLTAVDYYFAVKDRVGNSASCSVHSYSVTVDTHPPVLSSSLSTNDATTGGTLTATVTISDEASLIRVDGWYSTGSGWISVSVTDNNDGTYTITLTNAQYTYYDFKFEAEDQFNNIASKAYYDVIRPRDTIPPTIQNVQRTPCNPAADTSVLVKGEVFDQQSGLDPEYGGYGVKLRYKLGSSGTWTYLSMSPDTGNYYKATLPAYATGNVIYYQLIARDRSNIYRYSSQYSYTVVAPSPPSITGVSHSPWQPSYTNTMTFSAYIDAVASGGSITEARVYRKVSGGSYTYYSMIHGSGTYWYRSGISAGSAGKTYYYYIWAKDNYGSTSTSAVYSYTVSSSGGGLLTVTPYQLPKNLTALYQQQGVNVTVTLTEDYYRDAIYSLKYYTNVNLCPVVVPLVALNNYTLSTTVLVGNATVFSYKILMDIPFTSFHDESEWFTLFLDDHIPPEITVDYPSHIVVSGLYQLEIHYVFSDNVGLATVRYVYRFDVTNWTEYSEDLEGKQRDGRWSEHTCVYTYTWFQLYVYVTDTSGNMASEHIVIDITGYPPAGKRLPYWVVGVIIPIPFLVVIIWKRAFILNKIKVTLSDVSSIFNKNKGDKIK